MKNPPTCAGEKTQGRGERKREPPHPAAVRADPGSQDDQPAAPETPSQTPTWRRRLDMAAGIAILVGIVGLAVKPSLTLLWVFLLIFGLTALPELLIRRLRTRGR